MVCLRGATAYLSRQATHGPGMQATRLPLQWVYARPAVERLADALFIAALLLMVGICGFVTDAIALS